MLVKYDVLRNNLIPSAMLGTSCRPCICEKWQPSSKKNLLLELITYSTARLSLASKKYRQIKKNSFVKVADY